MTERRGTKALELWCRRITDGYPGVNVQNMTSSWRDGLAFCAMIHHFRPDLIDFDSLNKDDVYGNNELAFRTAAEHLGIPALLDAEDMASCSVPDRLSILTYLSQFYQSFGGSSPSRLALSRTKESSNEGITPVVAEPTTPKVGPRAGMRREPCAVCGMPVFLAEKLVISRTPYHRTCFRCARCANQLTPGNYYETEDGQYCCETCPDEEIKISTNDHETIYHHSYNEPMTIESENVNPNNSKQSEIYQRSLSDEEKTERRAAQFTDEKSVISSITSIPKEETIDKSSINESKHSQTAQMRLNFMTNHLLDNTNHNDEKSLFKVNENAITKTNDSLSFSPNPKVTLSRLSVANVDIADSKMPRQFTKDDSSIASRPNLDISDISDRISSRVEDNDDLAVRLSDKEIDNAETMETANYQATRTNDRCLGLDYKKIWIEPNTKDKIGPYIDNDQIERFDYPIESDRSVSLVQRRLRMFEGQKIGETSMGKSSTIFSSPDKPKDEVTEKPTNEKTSEIVEENLAEERMIGDKIVTVEAPMKENENEKCVSVVPKRSNLKVRRSDVSKDDKSDVTIFEASGIDLSTEENYPKDLNPFDSDEEIEDRYEKFRDTRVSANPFDSSDDEDEVNSRIIVPPRPATRTIPKVMQTCQETTEDRHNDAPTKRRLKAPQINFNPFWSDDDEDHESDDDQEAQTRSLQTSTPVPKPRTIRQTGDSFLSPWKNDLNRGDIYDSNSSLASTRSNTIPSGSYRKKKPAPPPPIVKELYKSGGDSPDSINTCTMNSNNSLRTTPRSKKTKPAPPPPLSTPLTANLIASMSLDESTMINKEKIIESRDYEEWKDPKNDKDEANRSKRNMTSLACNETSPYDPYTDKSVQGKWKRKKGPAPARPIPHRRKIKVVSLKDVKLELDEIEMQQQGLEKQGVRLEQLIRDKAETGNTNEDTGLGMDVEELVLELFALVNEKNELFRRQAELMLLRRQQRLEEEHADIEYQIRCLLCQPEATKTDFDKQREETLIQRLVEIVERRNEIVECLEMDRRREVEEDRSINTQMGIYAAKTKGDLAKELEEEENNRARKSKKTKLKEKAKEKILRKVHKKDADKDVDETEVKLKRQNKKKWF